MLEMHVNKPLVVLVLYISTVSAIASIRRTGWLDRVVEYHKKRFFEDFKKLPFVNVEAHIEKAPPGYVDSTDWDYNSVLRLLMLIRRSEAAKPVRQALRRALQPSRRFMSFRESLKAFPSLAKDSPNYFYYNVDEGEYYADVDAVKGITSHVSDDDVIFINNPVEARLPNARISVRLLKSIMEARSKARRYLSTTLKTKATGKSVEVLRMGEREETIEICTQQTNGIISSNSTKARNTTVSVIKI